MLPRRRRTLSILQRVRKGRGKVHIIQRTDSDAQLPNHEVTRLIRRRELAQRNQTSHAAGTVAVVAMHLPEGAEIRLEVPT